MLKRMLFPIFFAEQIKEGEMGAACRTLGGEDKYIQSVVGKPERKNIWET
jgi:hypothetical protein